MFKMLLNPDEMRELALKIDSHTFVTNNKTNFEPCPETYTKYNYPKLGFHTNETEKERLNQTRIKETIKRFTSNA